MSTEPSGAYEASRQRVERFLEAWDEMRDRDDMIYGLGVRKEESTRDLLASDLRVLVGAHRHAGRIGLVCHSHDQHVSHWHRNGGWSFSTPAANNDYPAAGSSGGDAR